MGEGDLVVRTHSSHFTAMLPVAKLLFALVITVTTIPKSLLLGTSLTWSYSGKMGSIVLICWSSFIFWYSFSGIFFVKSLSISKCNHFTGWKMHKKYCIDIYVLVCRVHCSSYCVWTSVYKFPCKTKQSWCRSGCSKAGIWASAAAAAAAATEWWQWWYFSCK